MKRIAAWGVAAAVCVCLVSASLLWAQDSRLGAGKGTKWEYHSEGWPSDDQLKKLGDDGWELAATVVMSDTSAATEKPGSWSLTHHQNTRYVFKRPK